VQPHQTSSDIARNSSPYTIRPARLDEHRVLEAIQRNASLVWEDTRAALLAHPDACDIPLEHLSDGQCCVAEYENTAVGFCIALPVDDGYLEIDGLFVEPAHWRKGIGRALLDFVESKARAEQIQALQVIANPNALWFYLTFGFEIIGDHPTAFGPAFAMWKPLWVIAR